MATLNTIEQIAYPSYPAFKSGVETKRVFGSYAKTASLPADDDYIILADKIPVHSCIHKINMTHAAIAGMTDVDIVLLEPDGTLVETGLTTAGDVVYLAETLSFETARADAKVNTNLAKPIKDLVGLGGDACPAYFTIAMLVNTAGSTANKLIEYDIEFSSPVC